MLSNEMEKKRMKNILIISSSLGDLNGFVEHLEEYRIAGKIYAANVMDAGFGPFVSETAIPQLS